MSMINLYGSYEEAKKHLKTLKDFNLPFDTQLLETELLEYRRNNGIFELYDEVVYCGGRVPHVYRIEEIHGDGSVTIVRNPSPTQPHWSMQPTSYIRHATDEEIKFGCRVDQINAKILEKFGGRENVATILENAEGLRNVSTLGMTVTVERLRVAYEQI